MNKLCDKIIQLRREKGLSQEQLADYLGVSRQSVSKWEAEQSTPSIDKIIQLSDIFGVSVDYLVRENVTSEEINKTVVTTIDDKAMLEQFDQLKEMVTHDDIYEYKSKRTLFGLPLVHVRYTKSGRPTVAKGIFAFGTFAIGVFTFGILTLGLVSFGALSIGLLLSFGAISIGGISSGGIAIGIYAFGGLSIGLYSFGGCAIASRIGCGGYASGKIAIGDVAKGIHAFDISEECDPKVIGDTIRTMYPRVPEFVVKLLSSFSN